MSKRQEQQAAEKKSAIHLNDRELITRNATEQFQTANKQFTALTMKGSEDHILEVYRNRAVAAYEALLDAVKTERDALNAHHTVMNLGKSKT